MQTESFKAPFKITSLTGATTAVGSFPHHDGQLLSQILASTLDIPCWPQLPRRDFRERMYIQFSANLPAIKLDETRERVYFDISGDITNDLERFYQDYLSEDLAAFRLRPDYSSGFYTMQEALKGSSGDWVKGQVTGPISFGLTVTDHDLRPSLYNSTLADAIVKNIAINARWQIRQLKPLRANVIIFVDEPYMAAFGSSFISLQHAQAVAMLDEVFAAIHQEGALAGVHCCANTDWSLLLATKVDILNLDAYGYLENLALYPTELRAFLDRGGFIAWGIVPNNDAIYRSTPNALARRLCEGIHLIQEKAKVRNIDISEVDLTSRSLLTTSCGLGPTTVPVAELAIEMLAGTGRLFH